MYDCKFCETEMKHIDYQVNDSGIVTAQIYQCTCGAKYYRGIGILKDKWIPGNRPAKKKKHSKSFEIKNYIHLEPMIKRKDRSFNNLKPGDTITVTISDITRQVGNATEIEILPVKIITEESRTIEVST